MFDGPWDTCMLVRGLNPSECASWVQAWGSILGIAAASAGVFWQVRKQRQQALEARVEQARSIANAVFWCRMYATELVEMVATSRNPTSAVQNAAHWVSELEAIPLLAFPTFEIKNAARRVVSAGQDLRRADAIPLIDDRARFINYNDRGLSLANAAASAEFLIEGWLRRHGSAAPDQAYRILGVTYNPIRRSTDEAVGIRSD